MTEIRTLTEFDEALAQHRHILITDKYNGDTIHRLPCSSVKREYFEQKVITNGGKNGRYYLLGDPRDAARAETCHKCGS